MHSGFNYLTEGRGWLEAALEQSNNAPAEVRFKLLLGLGVKARCQGDYETARKVYEEILATGRAANNLQQISTSNRGLGMVAYRQSDFPAARKFIEEALAICRKLDDKYGIAFSLNFLGELARTEGDDAAAGALFKESLETFRQLGNKEAVGANLANLGAIAFGEGNFATARSNFAEGLAMAQKMGSNIHISFPLDGFAALAARRGELERAAQLAGAAEHLRESIGYEIEPADRRFRDAYTSELKTKMSEEEFTKAYEQGRKLKLDEAIALALD